MNKTTKACLFVKPNECEFKSILPQRIFRIFRHKIPYTIFCLITIPLYKQNRPISCIFTVAILSSMKLLYFNNYVCTVACMSLF